MSGIVGIVNTDEAPVDPRLLQRMTDYMAFRGPDAQETWIEGHVGFGHTMLRTSFEAEHERQPCSLDGKVWITADCRVDGRKELIDKLRSRGGEIQQGIPDPALILQAYHVWGESCVDHLLGDFAFAIWDTRNQRLFCARDHFGVKPFYYAHLGGSLIFSNTLNAIRLHPDVSDGLNDLAIADFLLFDYNHDPATTTFADIQRVPAAHILTWSEGPPVIRRYWTLPVDGHIRYRRERDYVEQFEQIMDRAVGDRIRSSRLGVLMSGGLDSTSVAATAICVQSEEAVAPAIRAYTLVYDRIMRHAERHYSAVAAQSMGIPIKYLAADDYEPYERVREDSLYSPEPHHDPLRAIEIDQYRQISDHARIALTGLGGDPLFYQCPGYPAHLARNLRLLTLLKDLCHVMISRGRIPQLGVRSTLKRWVGIRPWRPPWPGWIDDTFASRLDLAARWEDRWKRPPRLHRTRPLAYELLTDVYWANSFEHQDACATRHHLEVRHPYFDVRLVRFMLAIPPLPWCVNKDLLRSAMRGRLPECVRLRPKSPLLDDPLAAIIGEDISPRWANKVELTPQLGRYVRMDKVTVSRRRGAWELWTNLRPFTLSHWLQNHLGAQPAAHLKEQAYGVGKGNP